MRVITNLWVEDAVGNEGGVEARLEWKPNILIVDNNKLSEVERIICPEQEHQIALDGRHACVPHDKSKRPRLKEVLAVYSTGDSDRDKRNVFVFPATEVGHLPFPSPPFPYAYKVDRPNSVTRLILIGHLNSSGMWSGVVLRVDTQKICV